MIKKMDDYSHISTKEICILRNALDSTKEGFVTIDENHKIFFFNEAAEKIFGYSKEEVIGRDLDIIMTPECSKQHRMAISRYLDTDDAKGPENSAHAEEMIVTRKDGTGIPVNISFSSFKYKGTTYFTAIIIDLTEIKDLKSRVVKAEELAALGKVVAEIVHEIRNPLMIIGGFAKQLFREHKKAKDTKKLKIIIDEIERLENLLKTIRAHYAPPAMVYRKVDLNMLLRDVFSEGKEVCKQKGIIARLDLEEDTICYVESDADKLKQVLLNLVKNAIEAMDNGGELYMGTRLIKGDKVEIIVSDTGCGIPDKIKPLIFDPFFTTKKDGTGLGLGICKQIIENHKGGRLSFESEENRGTTFRIQLPLYKE